jgi:ubiquinone/menaquinone biosynthesis C-methylase UbiE
MAVGTRNEATRVEWIKKTLAGMTQGTRILDAGAGERPFRKFCAHLDYVAQDFGEYDGSGDNKGLQMGKWDQAQLDILSDITRIPEPDASFGAIMCTEVLEHLQDPLAAIREFRRLLKVGGYLILTSPFCSLTHFSPFHFYSGFNRYFYKQHLEGMGFRIIEILSNGNYFEFLGQELRRLPIIARKYCQDYPRLYERVVIRLALIMLGRFANKDKGSKELLCFGYHVLAKKAEK